MLSVVLVSWQGLTYNTCPPPIAIAVVADRAPPVPTAVAPPARRANQTALATVADAAATPTAEA